MFAEDAIIAQVNLINADKVYFGIIGPLKINPFIFIIVSIGETFELEVVNSVKVFEQSWV